VGGEKRREKSLRLGVHHADAVVWEPVREERTPRSGTHDSMPRIKYRWYAHATARAGRFAPLASLGAHSSRRRSTTATNWSHASHFFRASDVGVARSARFIVSEGRRSIRANIGVEFIGVSWS